MLNYSYGTFFSRIPIRHSSRMWVESPVRRIRLHSKGLRLSPLIDGGYRAFLPVSIADKQGLSFVNTRTKQNMAGHKLYQHLKKMGIPSRAVCSHDHGWRKSNWRYNGNFWGRNCVERTPFSDHPDVHTRIVQQQDITRHGFIKQTGMILNLPEIKWRFNAPGWFLVDRRVNSGSRPTRRRGGNGTTQKRLMDGTVCLREA